MPPEENQGNQPSQPAQPPSGQPAPAAGQPAPVFPQASQPETPAPIPQAAPQPLPQQGNPGDMPPVQPVTPAVTPAAPLPAATPAPVPGAPGQTPTGAAPLTNPIAGEPAVAPLPPTPSGGPSGNKLNGFKKLIPVVGGVVVALGIAAFLFLSPLSPFGPKRVPQGPNLYVGDKIRYVHACSVIDIDTVAKTLELNNDRQKQNIEETYAFAPDNTTDKKLDLLKLTGEKSVSSDCRLRFDRSYTTDENGRRTATFKSVGLTIEQYPSEQDANNAFKAAKEQAGSNVKTLSSFGETSFYKPATVSQDGSYIQPEVLHKNLVIKYMAMLKEGDSDGSKLAPQLDTLQKDVAKRIDSGAGDKAKNFSGINKIGKTKLVDACRSVDYRKVASILGGETQFDQSGFGASQAFAPEDNDGKSPQQIASTCATAFRTKADVDAEKNKKPAAEGGLFAGLDLPDTYASKFPHILMNRIVATENKENALKMIDDAKKEIEGETSQQFKLEDVQLGDKGIKVTQKDALEPIAGMPTYDSQIYYIAKGSYVYFLSVTYTRQNDPYKTTDQTFTQDQMKELFTELTAATK